MQYTTPEAPLLKCLKAECGDKFYCCEVPEFVLETLKSLMGIAK
jgi:hypothetical protein